MKLEEIEVAYQTLNQMITIIQQQSHSSYFEALSDTLGKILEKQAVQQNEANDLNIEKFKKLSDKLNLNMLGSEEIRQIIQMTLLNAYRKEHIEPNLQMTPDVIGYLVVFLINLMMNELKLNSVLDLTVGTGNLLSTVINQLNCKDKLSIFGIDNDNLLLEIADASLSLQKIKNVELFHQDALDNLLIAPVNLVIGDLPVGYYPLDQRAVHFETHAEKGHSFAHYLLIEQGIRMLDDNGWAFLIVPHEIFEDAESQKLLKMIEKYGYFQGLLNLPRDLFISEKAQKSILMVQKKGKQAHQVSQVLLGEIPSIKNQKEFSKYIQNVKVWVKNNL